MDSVQIISAYLHNRQNCQTATVYQYNQGMILRIIGPELPQAYEVDFANSVTGQSITQIGNSEGVPIPDQFFTPGSMIHAWVVLTGVDYVVTRYHIMIPISPRAVRTSEEPTPSQQSAVDQAIAALNEAVDAAETAITHYPTVIDGYWHVWDVTAGEYVSTGVAAQGPQGDPGLDGVSPTVTVTSIPGGHRITITDATGAHSADVMDGESGVTDVQVNGTSVVTDGVANVPIATSNTLGVVIPNSTYGLAIDQFGNIGIARASLSYIKNGSDKYKPIVSSNQHESVFYGLSKAAGDATQSASSNPVGTYTDEAKAAIQQMLDVPSNDDIPAVPVQDVQVNGVSVLQDGVANVPVAGTSRLGVVYVNSDSGLFVGSGGGLKLNPAGLAYIKAGTNIYYPLAPGQQHFAAFYGLAKAAGADMASSSNAVGNYTDAAKAAILTMLGVSSIIGPVEGSTASQAYAIGDAFLHDGKLYKATAAIAQNDAIVAGTNCTQTTIIDLLKGA